MATFKPNMEHGKYNLQRRMHFKILQLNSVRPIYQYICKWSKLTSEVNVIFSHRLYYNIGIDLIMFF